MKMRVGLCLILVSFMPGAFASEVDCIDSVQKHIKEAIQHNKNRLIRYSALSEGRSESLSTTLITLEKMSALAVKNIEKEARLYREKGVPLLCEEIPSMDSLPEFQEQLPETFRPNKLYFFDHRDLNSTLKRLIEKNKFQEAHKRISDELYKMESEPNQMCMTRHFLESIAATLKFSDKHRKEAMDLNLTDPLPIIKKFLNLERKALFLTRYLDHRAFPLQKDGLLIFCQDVPAIDWK